MEPDVRAEQVSLDSVRRQRAELRESMSALELALAAPPAESSEHWAEHVHAALEDMSADFAVHVEVTEGRDGLYAEMLQLAPRLSDAVARLTDEHVVIGDLIGALLAQSSADPVDVEGLRVRGTALLGRLVRHRQRGSDLVYEAYEVDIGGDT